MSEYHSVHHGHFAKMALRLFVLIHCKVPSCVPENILSNNRTINPICQDRYTRSSSSNSLIDFIPLTMFWTVISNNIEIEISSSCF